MGQFARRDAPLRRCAGRERGGEQTACARQKPVQGRVFHLLRQLLWKSEVPSRYGPHQSGTEKSPAFQSVCRGFSDGGGLPGAAPPCGGALEASGSVSRPPAPGKSPHRAEFSTFCFSCCGKWKHPYGMPPIKAEQKNPRHSSASAGDFRMGAVCPVRWEQAGRASRTS